MEEENILSFGHMIDFHLKEIMINSLITEIALAYFGMLNLFTFLVNPVLVFFTCWYWHKKIIEKTTYVEK